MKTPLLLTTLALSLIHPPIALPASIMRPPSLSEQLLVAPMLNCAEYVKYHEEHKIEFEESFIQGWLATITEICETEKGNILSEMVTDRISEKLPGGLNGHMRTGIYAIENNNANLLSLYLACDTKEQELYLRMHEESYITAKDQLEEKKIRSALIDIISNHPQKISAQINTLQNSATVTLFDACTLLAGYGIGEKLKSPFNPYTLSSRQQELNLSDEEVGAIINIYVIIAAQLFADSDDLLEYEKSLILTTAQKMALITGLKMFAKELRSIDTTAPTQDLLNTFCRTYHKVPNTIVQALFDLTNKQPVADRTRSKFHKEESLVTGPKATIAEFFNYFLN